MDDAVRKVLLLDQRKFITTGFMVRSSNFIDIADKQSYLKVQRDYARKSIKDFY
jgi:hypothetical protein